MWQPVPWGSQLFPALNSSEFGDDTGCQMSEPTAKSFFVMTAQGDRGPLDRDGVRGLLRAGQARAEDPVRDIFGRAAGTVADLLSVRALSAGSDRRRAANSDRHRASAHSDRRAVPRGATHMRLPLVLATLVLVTLVIAVIAVLATKPPAPSPSVMSTGLREPTKIPEKPASTATRMMPSPPVAIPTQAKPGPAPMVLTPSPPAPIPVALPVKVVGEAPQSVPPGWLAYELSPTRPGSGPDVAAGIWTMRGAGHLFRSVSDGCRFAAAPLVGDSRVTARLLNVVTPNLSLVGIMWRLSTANDAPCVYLSQNASGRIYIGYRYQAGQTTEGIWPSNDQAMPLFLRMERRGTVFSCYSSFDGNAWRQVTAPITVPALSGPVFAGLFVSGLADSTVATFDNVVVEPLVADSTPSAR